MMILGEWIEKKVLWTIAVLATILIIGLIILFAPARTHTLICNGSDCELFPTRMVDSIVRDDPDKRCQKYIQIGQGMYWQCYRVGSNDD